MLEAKGVIRNRENNQWWTCKTFASEDFSIGQFFIATTEVELSGHGHQVDALGSEVGDAESLADQLEVCHNLDIGKAETKKRNLDNVISILSKCNTLLYKHA